jgi:hypothetical protein
VVGTIRSTEALYGGTNSWHLHQHVLVFVQGTPDVCALAQAINRWERVWLDSRSWFGVSREHLRVPVLSDEEIASAEVGGQDVAVIPVVAWNVVCSREGLLGQSSRRSNEAASGRPRRFSNPYDVVVLRPQARWGANAILRSGAVIV